MSSSRSITQHGFLNICTRVFWAGLALLHVRVLAGAIAADFDLPRLLPITVLALVVALFTLKALNARLLRFGSCRRSVLVFCLATAIVHHDAIAAESSEIPVLPALASVAGAVAVVEVVRRVARFVRSWHHLPGVLEPRIAQLSAIAWLPLGAGWSWKDAPCIRRASPRAPPFDGRFL